MNLPEELLDVRAIAFDVDGTLAGVDHHVSQRTLHALASLRTAGVEPIIVTGRIVQAATKILGDAGVEGYAIASNGAVAVDTRLPQPLRVATMDPGEVRAMVAFALEHEHQVEPIVFTADEMVVTEGSRAYPYLVDVHPEAPTHMVSTEDLPVTETTKAMLFGAAEDLDALDGEVRRAFPRMTRSMDYVFEMSAAGADKSVALATVLDSLGIPAALTAGVGDGENDVVWLKRVGWPVAMGNAREVVKAVARLEIGHHGDEAVAEFIETLLDARAVRS